MTVRATTLCLAAIAVSACVPPPAAPKPILHPTSITDAEKKVIEEAARDGLKDPDSAKFRHPQLYFGNEIYCIEVNAKNGFGGYTGFLPVEMFVTRIDGKIKVAAPIAYATANPNDGRTRAVIQICADNGY
ncbi:hypothetical protein [Zavarzinia sp.]|uniref:hypothetical protein n=1 Tax=Zavarzinia sp. TaxID=2027920 RepID=UPI003BB73CD0